MTTNTMQLKLINIEIVKSVLRNMEPVTKILLANETGLSTATCGNILEELVKSGEVMEISQMPSTGGRPSRQFIFNKNHVFVCAVYIRVEGNKLIIFSSIANLIGETVSENIEYPERITADKLIETMTNIMKNFPLIKAVSFGIPGVVSRGGIDTCDVPELERIKLQQIISERFDISVVVENDMNCAAAGFLNMTPEKTDNLAFVYYPEAGNPGCGIIINGRIVYGATNFAGELSYLPLGIPLEDLGRVQENKERFTEIAAKTIASLNCVVNPKKIIMAGKVFREDTRQAVRILTEELIPQKHLPEISFVTNIHESFVKGLTNLALEEVSWRMTIMKKTTRGIL